MKDKGHFYISITKSIIRIVGAMLCIVDQNILILAASFAIAEVLGIFEEVADKR